MLQKNRVFFYTMHNQRKDGIFSVIEELGIKLGEDNPFKPYLDIWRKEQELLNQYGYSYLLRGWQTVSNPGDENLPLVQHGVAAQLFLGPYISSDEAVDALEAYERLIGENSCQPIGTGHNDSNGYYRILVKPEFVSKFVEETGVKIRGINDPDYPSHLNSLIDQKYLNNSFTFDRSFSGARGFYDNFYKGLADLLALHCGMLDVVAAA